MSDLMETEVDRQDRVIQGLRDEIELLRKAKKRLIRATKDGIRREKVGLERIAKLEADCEMKDKRIDWTVADNVKKTMRIAKLEADLKYYTDTYDRQKAANENLLERIAKLEAALLENGKAFAAFGDHVRQAGCYALANSEVDHE